MSSGRVFRFTPTPERPAKHLFVFLHGCGATAQSIVGLVVTRFMGPIGVGIAAGLVGSALTRQVWRPLLYGIDPLDERVLLSGTLAVLMVALASTVLTARRAASIDPIVALRSE